MYLVIGKWKELLFVHICGCQRSEVAPLSIIALDIILHSLDERLNVVFKCVLETATQKRILFLPEYSFQEQLLCYFVSVSNGRYKSWQVLSKQDTFEKPGYVW